MASPEVPSRVIVCWQDEGQNLVQRQVIKASKEEVQADIVLGEADTHKSKYCGSVLAFAQGTVASV